MCAQASMHTITQERRDALRRVICAQDLSGLLVSRSPNRYYLSGFELHNPQENESAGMLFIAAEGPDMLFTDPRYRDAALRLWPEADLCIYQGNAPVTIAENIAARARGNIGIEPQGLNLEFFALFSAALPDALKCTRTQNLVENLRRIKSADELARMDRACALNHRMMEWLPSVLVPGKSEAAVAWELEKFFREHGASELAFASIVGRGINAALPHGIPSEEPLCENDLVLIDAGCRLDDYCSDQTRTFWVGKQPSARFCECLDSVREAQRRAIARIRPGVPCNEVFEAAWEHFTALGVAHLFTHGLGHGVGLETHEAPSLNRLSPLPLEPGMVVTVEPGLYMPDWGGVRWEHMVVVTEDGHRIM